MHKIMLAGESESDHLLLVNLFLDWQSLRNDQDKLFQWARGYVEMALAAKLHNGNMVEH